MNDGETIIVLLVGLAALLGLVCVVSLISMLF